MRYKGFLQRTFAFALIAVLSSSFVLQFGGLARGFDALQIYDYFKARKVFLSKVRSHPAASNFGLSVITERQDNPFHNVDSAFVYIERAEQAYRSTKVRKRVKLLKLAVDSVSIAAQKLRVQRTAWEKLKADPAATVHQYARYVETYGNNPFQDSALAVRNAMRFDEALAENSQASFRAFLKDHPHSKEAVLARNRLDEAIFRDFTAAGKLEGYVTYITSYPAGPFKGKAEDKIFELALANANAEEYERFIRKYPDNRNVNKAWRGLYDLKTKGAGQGALENFRANYPEYPFMSELSVELAALDLSLYPFSVGGKWGFMDQDGTVRIEPFADWVEDFEGVQAIVGVGEKVGTINKAGSVVIPIQFEDIDVVGEEYTVAMRNEKYGLVDRLGKQLIDFEYDFLTLPQEGLLLAEKDGTFGFLNTQGQVKVDFDFSDAQVFEDGRSVVEKDGSYGMVDPSGNTVVSFNYDFLEAFTGHWTRARKEEQYVLVDRFGQEFGPQNLTFIGSLNDYPVLAIDDENKVGFIDTTGTYIIESVYKAEANVGLQTGFREGYAIVRKANGKLGLIDTLGQQVLPFQYTFIGEIGDGIVAVSKNDQEYYYVDVSAYEKVGDENFAEARAFENGLGQVLTKNGTSGFVSNSGELTLFDSLNVKERLSKDLVVVADESGHLGVLRMDGGEFLPVVYDSIEPLNDKLCSLGIAGKKAYFRKDTRKFIWIEEGFPVSLD